MKEGVACPAMLIVVDVEVAVKTPVIWPYVAVP